VLHVDSALDVNAHDDRAKPKRNFWKKLVIGRQLLHVL